MRTPAPLPRIPNGRLRCLCSPFRAEHAAKTRGPPTRSRLSPPGIPGHVCTANMIGPGVGSVPRGAGETPAYTAPRLVRLGVLLRRRLERCLPAIAADTAPNLSPRPQFDPLQISPAPSSRSGQPDSAIAALDRLGQTGYSQPDQLLAESRSRFDPAADSRFAESSRGPRRAATPWRRTPRVAPARRLGRGLGRARQPRGQGHAGSIPRGTDPRDLVILETGQARAGGSGNSFNALIPRRVAGQSWSTTR